MKYYVLWLLSMVAIVAYVQRLSFAVSEELIRQDLGLDKSQVGMIMAAWLLGYALLQLPSGWLADRFGSRKSLTLFLVLWSCCLGMAAWCRSFSSLVAVWGCMGMAQAGVFPCSTKLIGQWFGPTQRATASGVLASSMALGIALSPLLTTRLLAQAGLTWQWTFMAYVLPGVLLAALVGVSIPAMGSTPCHDRAGSNLASQATRIDWRIFWNCVPLWFLCGQQFFRAAAMMFFQSWFPTFLRETRGVDLLASGNLTFVVGLGAFLGGMTGGVSSDWLLVRTGSRRLARQGIAVIGMLSCAGLIGISYFIAYTPLAIGCVVAGAFLATFGGVSGYTVAIELGGRQVATTFSLMNMCGNIGAALFPYTVGYMNDLGMGWGSVVVLCVLILVIDALCWALLNPTHTVTGEELAHARP